MNKEQELLEKYLAYKDAEETARKSAEEMLKQIAELAPHKVGVIIKWKELAYKKTKISRWEIIIEDLVEVEKTAALSRVYVDSWAINYNKIVKYKYEFSHIKKDGTISLNTTYPGSNYEWTGEHLQSK